MLCATKGDRHYLKNLDILDIVLSSALLVNSAPLVDDAFDVGKRKPCKGEVVARMETYNIATTLDWLCRKKRMGSRRRSGSGRGENGSKIVLKDHGVFVLLVLLSSRTTVAWTEIALGVVLRKMSLLRGLRLAEPWTLCTMRGNENMLARQRVHYKMC